MGSWRCWGAMSDERTAARTCARRSRWRRLIALGRPSAEPPRRPRRGPRTTRRGIDRARGLPIVGLRRRRSRPRIPIEPRRAGQGRDDRAHDTTIKGDFHNVYINPEAYRAYRETGKFPDPTILVMEVFQGETRDAKGVLERGWFEGKRVGVEVAVKDANRPGGGVPWAYYNFASRRGIEAVHPRRGLARRLVLRLPPQARQRRQRLGPVLPDAPRSGVRLRRIRRASNAVGTPSSDYVGSPRRMLQRSQSDPIDSIQRGNLGRSRRWVWLSLLLASAVGTAYYYFWSKFPPLSPVRTSARR